MAEISLPDLSLQWASAGDVLKPSNSKIQQGWQVEIPPRQWFNWYQNRTDLAICHIAQHGISAWSPFIEYQAGKSYVQGSDGDVYRALITNVGIDPVVDTSQSWRKAFVDALNTPIYGTNYIQYPNGYIDQWASKEVIVPTAVGSSAETTITYPVALSSILNIQLTHDLGSSAESAEMAYSISAKNNTSVTVRFLRVSGSNTSGTETVRASIRVMGIVAS